MDLILIVWKWADNFTITGKRMGWSGADQTHVDHSLYGSVRIGRHSIRAYLTLVQSNPYAERTNLWIDPHSFFF